MLPSPVPIQPSKVSDQKKRGLVGNLRNRACCMSDSPPCSSLDTIASELCHAPVFRHLPSSMPLPPPRLLPVLQKHDSRVQDSSFPGVPPVLPLERLRVRVLENPAMPVLPDREPGVRDVTIPLSCFS